MMHRDIGQVILPLTKNGNSWYNVFAALSVEGLILVNQKQMLNFNSRFIQRSTEKGGKS